MTLNFQIRREDALALFNEYYATSQTYRNARKRYRLLLPLLCLAIILLHTYHEGIDAGKTLFTIAFAILWFFFYPKYLDSRIRRYNEKLLSESSYSKSFGPATITLGENEIYSSNALGSSTFAWAAISRAKLTDTHLLIYLSGLSGFTISISDIGQTVANQAYDFIVSRIADATSTKS